MKPINPKISFFLRRRIHLKISLCGFQLKAPFPGSFFHSLPPNVGNVLYVFDMDAFEALCHGCLLDLNEFLFFGDHVVAFVVLLELEELLLALLVEVASHGLFTVVKGARRVDEKAV